ncbi:hypothetical protein Ciccas_008512 [Cichlidogyrus casuarinus]|uniref:Uncharacterized protein n=1 Tax=Cichlidogyrus casuarinus TaxID=1844966 RepID=A0ABD2Q0K4_9PLAT
MAMDRNQLQGKRAKVSTGKLLRMVFCTRVSNTAFGSGDKREIFLDPKRSRYACLLVPFVVMLALCFVLQFDLSSMLSNSFAASDRVAYILSLLFKALFLGLICHCCRNTLALLYDADSQVSTSP